MPEIFKQDNYVNDVKNTQQEIDKTTNEIFKDVSKYQKKFNLKMTAGTTGHNDETDAFRHAYMQARFTINNTKSIAKLIGNEHELWYHKPKNMPKEQWNAETNMDKWNNVVGREVGLEVIKELKGIQNNFSDEHIKDMIAIKLKDRIKNGELITDPLKDTRNFDDSGYNNRVYTREEIGKMSTDEFQKHEKFINKNMKDNKIMTKKEADEAVKSGNLIYVNSYTRSDGTEVKGYYRRKN